MELHRDIAVRKQRMSALRERYPASGGADSVYEQEVLQMEAELSQDEQRLDGFAQELNQIGGRSRTPSRVSWIFLVTWMANECGCAGKVTNPKCFAGIPVNVSRVLEFRCITK